jgi:DNA-binding transcriptional MerR regulator
LTIQELARRAGVTTRTIRYYTEQGLLPPPERGRPARYTEEHLRRLELIKRLKEQYLPLEEIRDTLQRLTLPELEGLLEEHVPVRLAETPVSSASEYIANVLGQGAVREQLKHRAAPAHGPMPVPPASPAAAATPSPAAQAVPAGARHMPMPKQVGKLSEQVGALPGDVEPGVTTWRRVALAPGIELHYLASGDARVDRLATRIAEAATHILEESPDYLTEEP